MRNREILYLLPWPPSVNKIWRSVRGRNILSKEYREWLEKAQLEIKCENLMFQRKEGDFNFKECEVLLILFPPNRRKMDIDNRTKPVLDLLTKSGIWKDDSIVKILTQRWGEPVKDGNCVVLIKEIEYVPFPAKKMGLKEI